MKAARFIATSYAFCWVFQLACLSADAETLNPPAAFPLSWTVGLTAGVTDTNGSSVNSTAPGGFYKGAFNSFSSPYIGAEATLNITQFGQSSAPFGTWYVGVGPIIDLSKSNSIQFQGTGGGFPVNSSGTYTQADYLASAKLTTALSADYYLSIFGAVGGATVWSGGMPTGFGGPRITGNDAAAAYRIGIEVIRRINALYSIALEASWDHRNAVTLQTSMPGESFRFGENNRFMLGATFLLGDPAPNQQEPPRQTWINIQDRPLQPAQHELPANEAANCHVVPGHEGTAWQPKNPQQVAVNCNGHIGTISIRTGVGIQRQIINEDGDGTLHFMSESKPTRASDNNMISLTYEGTGAEDCHWIQFIWREAEVTGTGEMSRLPASKNEQSTKKLSGPTGTGTGQFDFTPDSTSPKWHTDVPDKGSGMFYDGRNAPFRRTARSGNTPPSLTMFDQPEQTSTWANNVNPNRLFQTVISGTSTAHFESYLACKRSDGHFDICAKVTYTMKYKFTDPKHQVSTQLSGQYEDINVDVDRPFPSTDQLQTLDAEHSGHPTLERLPPPPAPR